MSSTPSSCARGQLAKGAARRTRSNRSSTVRSPTAQMATTCWASTSSGLRGTRVASTSPRCMARVTAAVASRSPRYLGKMTPRDDRAVVAGAADALHARWPPTAGPRSAPPGRWRPCRSPARGTSGDDRGQAPGLERVLDLRALLAGQRAVVRARQLLPRQLVERRRQPLGQAPAVHEDQGRAVGADELQQPRMDRGPDRAARRRRRRALRRAPGSADAAARRDMSSTGTSTRRSRRLPAPASTIDTGRARHVRARLAAAQVARHLLQRALGGGEADALQAGSRRAPAAARGDSARWAPRLVPTMVWISSTITTSTAASIARACEVRTRNSDSGRGDQDVGRVAGHARALRGRGVAGADADRRARGRRRRAARPPARCRPAARAGCARRPRPARAAARRRARGSARAWRARARTSAGRWRTGTRPASCRSRWARTAASTARRGSPASPAPGRASARGTCPRTTPPPRGGSRRRGGGRPPRHAGPTRA